MLKKEHRLRKNKQFNYVYKHGQAKHSKYLSLVFVTSKLTETKIGFSVSKKIGKSVVRSKVKRRLSEIVKPLLPIVCTKYNCIFIAKEGIANLTFDELKKEVMYVLKKANLINEKDN